MQWPADRSAGKLLKESIVFGLITRSSQAEIIASVERTSNRLNE